MGDERSSTLTIAIAEYEHLGASRIASHQGSGIRYNLFLVLVSASVALLAAIVAAGDRDSRRVVIFGVIVGGALVVYGIVTFIRLLEFTVTQDRYNDALNLLRTWFVSRAPDLAPYCLLPILSKEHHFLTWRDSGSLVRIVTSLAGTVGLVNSIVLGGSTGGVLWYARGGLLIPITFGVLTLMLSELSHILFHQRYLISRSKVTRESLAERLAQMVDEGNTSSSVI